MLITGCQTIPAAGRFGQDPGQYWYGAGWASGFSWSSCGRSLRPGARNVGMLVFLETDRLLLRQFDRRDADLLVELDGDPTWAALQVCGFFLRQPDQAKLVLHRAGRPIVLRQLAGPDPVCIGEELAE